MISGALSKIAWGLGRPIFNAVHSVRLSCNLRGAHAHRVLLMKLDNDYSPPALLLPLVPFSLGPLAEDIVRDRDHAAGQLKERRNKWSEARY